MTVRIITQPPIEPVSLSEMRLHLRERDAVTAQDPLISALIQAVREYGENMTGRAFVYQELEYSCSSFPSVFELPRPPLISVSSIKYTDSDGAEQTVSPALYQVDSFSEPGLVKPVYLETWPSDVRSSDFNAVRVRYFAGYPPGSPVSDLAESVPEGIKAWLKVRVAQLYEHREAVVVGNIVSAIPRDFVDGLLDRYLVGRFG